MFFFFVFFCGKIDGGREKVRGDDSSIDGTHLGIFPDSCADMISFNSFAGLGTNCVGTTRFYLMTH